MGGVIVKDAQEVGPDKGSFEAPGPSGDPQHPVYKAVYNTCQKQPEKNRARNLRWGNPRQGIERLCIGSNAATGACSRLEEVSKGFIRLCDGGPDFFKGVGELKQVDWELWLHGEGIPDFDLTAHVDKTLLEESRQAANRWLVEAPQDLQIMSLKAQQVMLILDHLINALADGQSLSHEKLAAMDGQYNLSGTRNVEIGFRWCLLGCRCKWPGCLPATESFLASHGRGVYVKPLYIALKAFDAARAKSVFDKNCHFYMTVISRQISSILGE